MIHVVGGTYLEFCREPHWYELFGSGLRAAQALASLGEPVKLSTFVASKEKPVLLAKSKGIRLDAIDANATVVFNYLHPLSKPAIEPDSYVRSCSQHPVPLKIEGDKVLRFGLVEGDACVKGKMVTYDPQTPSDPRPFGENGSEAERLAVVANRVEACRMTGEAKAEKACKSILAQGAEVAVVKCGAAGCVVGTAKGISSVPAYRTRLVWPIGSGDVFSALFAQGWMELGLSPVEAADRAARGASYFVERRMFPTARDLRGKSFIQLRRLPRDQHQKVYLAGPFFNLPQRWLIEEFKFALQEAGLHVFSPLHDVGRGDAEAVYAADIDGLKESGVVLACLDGLDPGTIYEVGYAHSRGSKVIAFVSAERPEDLKMIIGGGSQITNDFATALYLTVWAATCR